MCGLYERFLILIDTPSLHCPIATAQMVSGHSDSCPAFKCYLTGECLGTVLTYQITTYEHDCPELCKTVEASISRIDTILFSFNPADPQGIT